MNFFYSISGYYYFFYFYKKVFKFLDNNYRQSLLGFFFIVFILDNKFMILDLKNNFEVYVSILWKIIYYFYNKVKII